MEQVYPQWLERIRAQLAASLESKEWPRFNVSFTWGSGTVSIDITSGHVISVGSSDCHLEAEADTFADLVDGRTTMQAAHLSGRLRLSGQPEDLMRLALLFDSMRVTEA